MARYEGLRSQVLARPDTRSSYGLALFIRHGLVSWMAAWATFAAPAVKPPPQAAVDTLPVDLHAELAATLATMALQSRQGRTP